MVNIVNTFILLWMPHCLYTQSNDYGVELEETMTRGGPSSSRAPAEPEDNGPGDFMPQRCIVDLEIGQRHCCLFPPFFGSTQAAHCGAAPEVSFKTHASTGFRRYSLRGCDYWRCILDEYHLLDKDNEGYVSVKRFYQYLDKWTTFNPEFKDAISEAKQKCLSVLSFLFPMEVCDFKDLSICIRSDVNMHCPTILATQDCRDFKKYYEECANYM